MTLLVDMIRVEPGDHPFGVRRRRTVRRPAWHDVGPLATARVTRPFSMASVPLTHEQYTTVLGEQLLPWVIAARRDKRGRRRELVPGVEQCPIDDISWYDSVRFCNRLSALEGYTPAYQLGPPQPDGTCTVTWQRGNFGYRLPTEAEWDMAATAGCAYKVPGGAVDHVAWHRGNSAWRGVRMPRPVGLKRPNRWGLYDMGGNAFEWCWDELGPIPTDRGPLVDWAGPGGLHHVPGDKPGLALRKGGAASFHKIFCRISERHFGRRLDGGHTGLRLVRTIR